VTDRCNLRCQYCMPAEGIPFLPHPEILRYEEIEHLIRIAAHLGITKVRLTGGEPLLRKGIIDFIRRVRQIAGVRAVSLTTNGILLDQYARALKDAGVAYLNISLDTLQRERFQQITRFDQIDQVLQGIHAAQEAGFERIKVNAVAIRGWNDDELFDFVTFADQQALEVRFIEYMPFPGNDWRQDGFISAAELRARLSQQYQLVPLSGDPAAAAQVYTIPGHGGQIGFIASVSESFCPTCNRLRLTADGQVRPCLHGPIEFDLKTPLRRGASEAELADLFRAAVASKPHAHHDFLDGQYQHPIEGRAMTKIGG